MTPLQQKTRDERYRELFAIMQGPDGFERIYEICREVKQLELGVVLPVGTTAGQMIDAILEAEYPAEAPGREEQGMPRIEAADTHVRRVEGSDTHVRRVEAPDTHVRRAK